MMVSTGERLLIPPTGRYSAWLVAMFVALTAADLATTLVALAGGDAIEFNPAAAHAGGLRVGFLIGSNLVLLVPLLLAFVVGVNRAGRVPADALARWWRHILDIFYVNPLADRARARAPMRLVTATMTLITIKAVVLFSNVLAIFAVAGPVSLLARLATATGLYGAARYWTAYLLLVAPCYCVGVALAAMTLRAACAARAPLHETSVAVAAHRVLAVVPDRRSETNHV